MDHDTILIIEKFIYNSMDVVLYCGLVIQLLGQLKCNQGTRVFIHKRGQ